MFAGRCEPRRRGSRGGLGLLVWKRSWAFGSSVVGCSAGVVRMRFWAPGSPPQAFCLARFDARRAWGPAVCRRDGVAVRGGLRTG